MSETAAAILILPFLVMLTLALECTRIGCRGVVRRRQSGRLLGPEQTSEFHPVPVAGQEVPF